MAKEDRDVRNDNASLLEMKQNWLKDVFESLKLVDFFVRCFTVRFSDVFLLHPVSGKSNRSENKKAKK